MPENASQALLDVINALPEHPGVYLFFNAERKIIYIGKAKNLKKRVKSYFVNKMQSHKVAKMRQHVCSMEYVSLNTESEALLLECELIKKHMPRYNVLLRDDKSFPYILLDRYHPFPKLNAYRGERVYGEGQIYYGPYASPAIVKQTLDVLHQLFQLRQCTDHDFKTRTRPCLQFQIKRCSAPCMGYISESKYNEAVSKVEQYLRGGQHEIISDFIQKMNEASNKEAYELAADYRDKVKLLNKLIQSGPSLTHDEHSDLVTFVKLDQIVCAYVFFFREGACKGARYYFLDGDALDIEEDYPSRFVSLFYLHDEHPIGILPKTIYISKPVHGHAILEEIFKTRFNANMRISSQIPTQLLPWLQLATQNGKKCLQRSKLNTRDFSDTLLKLFQTFDLDEIGRIECFDISHTQGNETIAACVVYGVNGPERRLFRRFRISGITPGDDYAAIFQAVQKRYRSMLERGDPIPAIILIDGGQGQLKQAYEALKSIDVDCSQICLLSIAKGMGRKAIYDTVYKLGDKTPVQIAPDTHEMQLLQQIRDEAHRYAITNHRRLRSKKAMHSILEEIPGIGQAKRRILLQNFGGLEEIKQATALELAKVPGISENLANVIVEYLKNR